MEQQAWQQLTQIIQDWINPQEIYFGIGEITDAEDGSGDGILTFPDGLCEKMGWKEGDSLNIELRDEDTLVLSKKYE